MSDGADPSSATDSDTSSVSLRPDFDTTDDSDSGEASDLTVPETTCLRDKRSRSETRPKRQLCRPANAGDLLDFSDDPDDDTDEDLADVPLDYGRSEKTKVRGRRIEKRWHK